MARPAPTDRYEPLPPLVQVPGWLVRKLSRRGRRIALLALAAVALATAVGVPALVAAKHRNDVAHERAAQRAHAARLAALRAEVRRIDGRGTAARGLAGGSALAARRALVQDLSTAVAADARARVRSGEFGHATARVDCSRYPVSATGEDPAAALGRRYGRYACLAVTADILPGRSTNGGAIGYPYRARVDFASGRFALCKVSGVPGEGSLLQQVAVPVPAACGG